MSLAIDKWNGNPDRTKVMQGNAALGGGEGMSLSQDPTTAPFCPPQAHSLKLGGTLTSFLGFLCICWVPVQILDKHVRI